MAEKLVTSGVVSDDTPGAHPDTGAADGARRSAILDTIVRTESDSTSIALADETAVVWSRACGCEVWDEWGRHLIDLTSGSGVASVGHAHPRIVAATEHQLRRVMHTGWQFATPARAALLHRLAPLLPKGHERIAWSVTGADAVECAIKTAVLATGRPRVLAFEGGYHGRSLGTLRVTDASASRADLGISRDGPPLPLPDQNDCGHDVGGCGPRCWEATAAQLAAELERGDVAAAIVEPIQGGGMRTPPHGFLAWLAAELHAAGALVVHDEIFTGLGRTGSFFAAERDAAVPDLLVFGKALGGGIPIAAMSGPSSIVGALGPLRHTSTFAAHPLAMAAGTAVLDVIEEERLVDRAEERGAELIQGLRNLGHMVPLRLHGRGLMLGVELHPGDPRRGAALARQVVLTAPDHGLLLFRGGSAGATLRITPPLTLSAAQVRAVVDRLEACIDAAAPLADA